MEADKGNIREEVREDGDELHAWCLLEESENEQWQEVAGRERERAMARSHQPTARVDVHPGRLPHVACGSLEGSLLA